MSCEVINPTAALPELGADVQHMITTQVASLRIIVEQSMERNSYLYINFDDYTRKHLAVSTWRHFEKVNWGA